MTIEEKMEHFRRMSLQSANSQSAESLSSYKNSLDDDLETHKETAAQLAEESKKALLNQVRANSKKELTSAQMKIKKQVTNKQATLKSLIFDEVRNKISEYRKTPEYLVFLENQIKSIINEYADKDITIYIDPDDSDLLDELKSITGGNIEIYSKQFYGGTRTIVPEMNILIDNSFKTRIADEQESFTITL